MIEELVKNLPIDSDGIGNRGSEAWSRKLENKELNLKEYIKKELEDGNKKSLQVKECLALIECCGSFLLDQQIPDLNQRTTQHYMGMYQVLRGVVGISGFEGYYYEMQKILKEPSIVQDYDSAYLAAISAYIRYERKIVFPHVARAFAKAILEKYSRNIVKVQSQLYGEDTVNYNLTTEFIFQLKNSVRDASDKKTSDKGLLDAKGYFCRFLDLKGLSFDSKWRFINALLVQTDVRELMSAYNKLALKYKDELENSVKNAFAAFKEKYIKNGDDIFENEEKVIYILYQYWSGKHNKLPTEEVKSLRRIVSNHIANHPEVAKYFWSRLPDHDPRDPNDFDIQHRSIFVTLNLLLPIEKLVGVTEKLVKGKKIDVDENLRNKIDLWKRLMKDDDIKGRYLKLESTEDTLRGKLIRKGILED